MTSDPIYVGVDLARRSSHKAVVLRGDNAQSPPPKRAISFSHDLDGFKNLRGRILDSSEAGSLNNVLINMEPTSGVWEVLAAYLTAEGATVCTTRTDVVSQLRKVHSRFAKTDRVDARTLAGIPTTFPERLVRYVPPEERTRKLRHLSAQRQRLVEDSTRWKNRFIAKAEVVWGPLLVELEDEQRLSSVARAFFTKFVQPQKAAQYGYERFKRWFGKTAHGNTSPGLVDVFWQGLSRTAELWTELEQTGAMSPDWNAMGELLAQDLRMIACFEDEIAHTDARIRQARHDVPECDLLQELPGVGKVISVSLAGLLMPAGRFPNSSKCSAYTGFTSRQKASADKELQGLRITKSGNRRIKRDLALAADTAMHCDPQLAQFAIKLLAAGKHYNKVRVAVGRKIALRAYALLKRHENGEENVHFQWRDPAGRPTTEKEAKRIARELWANHRLQTKGNPPDLAIPGPSEDATERSSSEFPNPSMRT